ncbi:hypothetical protein ABPG74_013989 [Tetrahymena malaccensis]
MRNNKSVQNNQDDNQSHHSQTSAVVRKFEELRQSIQLNNSVQDIRQSVNQSFQTKNVGDDGNKQPHQHAADLENIKVTPQQETNHATNKKMTKDEQAKAQLASKVDHKISIDEVCSKYQTKLESGLTQQQADHCLQEYGPNKLSEKKKTPWWVKLIKELTNGFALMLWVGGALCFITYGLTPDDPSNLYLGVVIIIVISITSGITFQQNAKSEALMDSFKNFIPQNSTVIRDGTIKIVNAINLVVGDVVMIKAGEKIPADLRIVESNEMKVDNSPLTGESEPLLRTVECTHPENYLETSNIAFFGTLCKEGTGKGVVICTGDRTTLGQIADLSSGERKVRTPLRIELDRFVVMITFIAVFLGILFFLLAYLAMDYPILTCVIFGIGILVANVPEGLLGCITISLAITAKNLAKKQVLVKNLEAVETLGSTSCICSDKTGTLTQNVMSVKHMWYNNSVYLAKNQKLLAPGETTEYDINDPNFRMLQQATMICSEARFDTSTLADQTNIDYMTCPVIGDATETGLIRFYQYISDVNKFRDQFKVVRNPDGTVGKMPFNSQVKFALTIVEEKGENSHYCAYVKGAPEKIWSFCSSVLINQKPDQINQKWKDEFKKVNLRFGKGGERVLGFAKLPLPANEYPIGTHFTVSSVQKFNFRLENFQFCGLISLMDPPKTRVPGAILECKSAGIKVIMVTGDQPPTAAAIAKEVNIIPSFVITNEDVMEKNPDMNWFEATEQCEAIVVHGDRIVESIEKCIEENRDDKYYYLRQWVKKPYCVFARTTPAQKLQIVEACQQEQYICAVTGDGVNDSPAIKQGDIGISMNISGSDVTKDAADMILLDDDFASIVSGVEEGRKIFDNLKKTVVYLLTSNMTEIIPFLAFIALQLPVPLSSIFMLVICVGTDIWPALSLAYEEAELDVMTRRPRKKDEHLVSGKLITIAYLQMGEIACAAGFIGYFVCFNYFGFPVKSLFGQAVFSGYRPPEGDFKSYDGGNPYYNRDLEKITQGDCNKNFEAAQKLVYTIDWSLVDDGKYDLRKAYLKCNSEGKWVPTVAWSDCDVDSNHTYSVITGVTACYNTDAIKWAQSVYFVCIVVVQWSNIFACKSRKMSFTNSAFNSVMVQGVIFETALAAFLLYVPGVQDVFGGRPLSFWMFGVPGLFISSTLLVWDEFRKFSTRTSRWFLKYALW